MNSKITREDVLFVLYGLFREAVFLCCRVVCLFRGHKGFEWRTFATNYGPMRERSCERCCKTESDYSGLNQRGKEIVGLVRAALTDPGFSKREPTP